MKTLLFLLAMLPFVCSSQAISYKNKVVKVGDKFKKIGKVKLEKDQSYYIYVWSATCPTARRINAKMNESTLDSFIVIGVCLDEDVMYKKYSKDLKWHNMRNKNFTTKLYPCGFVVVNNVVAKTNYYYY